MISVSALAKSFSGETGVVRAVDGIEFEVPAGKLLTLLGPSGCGKTTTLRCLAGLERPERGYVHVGAKAVVDTTKGVFVPVHRRKIGMVFQSYAIWPHMTVFQNVSYPLAELRLSRSETRRRTEAALALVGLQGLETRFAPNLSGGQQQRVALARALVAEPEVLLLDEPLSNLDAKLRENMRGELRALQQRLGITTVYVTHDQIEALSMSDITAVMNGGKIIEQGTPRQLYERPGTRFTADFLGLTNFLTRCPHGCEAGAGDGHPVRSIRPEDVQVSRTPVGDGRQVWPAQVTRAVFLGSHTYCELEVGGEVIKANVHHSIPMEIGDRVFVWWDLRYCVPVVPDGSPAPQRAGPREQPQSEPDGLG